MEKTKEKTIEQSRVHKNVIETQELQINLYFYALHMLLM